MMPRAICLEDDASPVDLAGAYLPLKGRRRLSVFSAGVSVHSGTPSGSCCSSDRVDLPLPGCRPDFLEKPGLLWSVMEQRLPSQSLQDFCLLCRSLPRLTNPSPVLRRACVALQGVLPPGSLVLGPHRKLRHSFPTGSQGPPADPGTSCIGGGPGCFPGRQSMPVSALTLECVRTNRRQAPQDQPL